MKKNTVTIRIAVVVNEEGDWSSAGWPGAGKEAYFLALDAIADDPHKLYWLEAELELPSSEDNIVSPFIEEGESE